MSLDRKGSRFAGGRPGIRKKRRFHGNQFTEKSEAELNTSASAKKLTVSTPLDVDINRAHGYVFEIMADKAASSPVVAAPGATAAVTVGTPKKPTAAKLQKTRAKAIHPKTAEMVNAAILALKERGGSSVQAMKKYMVGTYKVDAAQQATFIKKYLKAAVASGVLIQTKGTGAAGSFKLSSAKVEAAKPKGKPASKTVATKKAAAAKKPVAAKKVKPPKAKTTKAKPAAKSPAKTKPAAAKKAKAAAAKPKKAAPKKTTASKK